MDKRAKLSVVLIVAAFATGAIVATGTGARSSSPDVPATAPVRRATTLSDIASPAEMKLWNDRGCVTCHGPEARGTPMGPDLVKVLPLYFAKFGTADAVRDRLAAHMIDPQGSPKLRDDGVKFAAPMPAIESLYGGTKPDATTLADLLVRLAR